MKINFNKPVLVINSNEFKVYCKKRYIKDVFRTLRGDFEYGY